MRGKATGRRSNTASPRITPAHAGKSGCPFVKRLAPRDHPRPCGEKQRNQSDIMRDQGSPPPMRGKGWWGLRRALSSGITPAHAGKSYAALLICYDDGDHPRPCGEKPSASANSDCDMGSPPPMRGKAFPIQLIAVPVGITPAHAGKRSVGAGSTGSTGDHPRPCGEKQRRGIARVGGRGSPPPMRGKGILLALASPIGGITPAHAGKSHSLLYPLAHPRDHPRPCGEKQVCYDVSVSHVGSPPPMRGKERLSRPIVISTGITPAHAGKRPRGGRASSARQDHPRPCGEK